MRSLSPTALVARPISAVMAFCMICSAKSFLKKSFKYVELNGNRIEELDELTKAIEKVSIIIKIKP